MSYHPTIPRRMGRAPQGCGKCRAGTKARTTSGCSTSAPGSSTSATRADERMNAGTAPLIMAAILAAAMSLCGPTAACAAAPRAKTPQIFAPGVISGPLDDASPAFSPDGQTVYFVRGDEGSTLMESHRDAGRWALPHPVPFSGRWRDLDPAMAPDGSYLLFVSNRPITPDGKPLELVYQGKVYPSGMNIWRVDRKGSGWTDP